MGVRFRRFPSPSGLALTGLMVLALQAHSAAADVGPKDIRIGTNQDWQEMAREVRGITIENGMAVVTGETALYRSKVVARGNRSRLRGLVAEPSVAWKNWQPVGKVGPTNIEDAPVFLVRGDKDYWLMGLYNGKAKDRSGFQAKPAMLEGFDVPLLTTPYERQYDAPGGLQPGLGGYHAWQSRDMVHWVHHGPVTERFSRWVTTAEMVDGKTYIYYDFPNDQDPHLYVDDDLTDGRPGKNMGVAFRSATDGSDCAVIRGLDGGFHLIYEDWSPVDASTHSWDSPLAGHAVSDDGMKDFRILSPAVDERTTPTGVFKEFAHPHWHAEDPARFPGRPSAVDIRKHGIKAGDIRAFARYEVHEPEQNAYGDWAAISIGGHYYLFGDFHPAGSEKTNEMGMAIFSSSGIDKPFEFRGKLGSGHPDPDIGFAEGQFYLINQTANDYVSPGPWIGDVEARAGVDTDGDGGIDQWTEWRLIRETYEAIEGFAKQVKRHPAELDATSLPAGLGFGFELRIKNTGTAAKPEIDSIRLEFED